ncbi:MAG: sigma 54-interacting transcriptional regulator [Bacillota bacterium]
MEASQLLCRDVSVLYPGSTLAEAAGIFAAREVNCIPIIDEQKKPVGILTIYGFVQNVLKFNDLNLPVERAMEQDISVINGSTPLKGLGGRLLERLLVVDDNGKLVGVLTKLDLILHLYHSLLKTQGEFQAVVASVPAGIVASDCEGNVVLQNKQAENILGISHENAVGRSVGELIPDPGFMRVVQTGQVEFGKKIRVQDKTLLVSRSPILIEGTIVGSVTCLQDISQMEAIQEELSHIQRLYRELESVIESSYDGIIVTDTQKILNVNSSFERISGLGASCLVGKPISELNKEHICLESIMEVFELVRSGGSPVTVLRKLRKGNEIYLTGNPILAENGEIRKILINVRDVTELSRLKEQVENLTAIYKNELEELRARFRVQEDVVMESPAMKKAMELVIKVARVDSIVLIEGESGVGKEVLAKLIHGLSNRREGPLVQINCGAIPENLLESELFGYQKGSFTGANKEGKAGLFEMAQGGTLFLDEISELSLVLQVKLLKAIQDREIYRIGGVKPVKLDLRIIAATNQDLKELVRAGRFRQDLYYRMNVVLLRIPPLRERREDIIPLVYHFLSHFNQKYGFKKTIASEVIRVLEKYDWPGNVRELQNAIERMVVISEGDLIRVPHLPETIWPQQEGTQGIKVEYLMPLEEARELVEKELVAKALAVSWNTRQAAQILGVDHSTVVRKARRYGLRIAAEPQTGEGSSE